jgi:hypothetical protein
MEIWIIREICFPQVFNHFVSTSLEDAKNWVDWQTKAPLEWQDNGEAVHGWAGGTSNHWSIEKIRILQEDQEFVQRKIKDMVI